jgi:hypothetical protein
MLFIRFTSLFPFTVRAIGINYQLVIYNLKALPFQMFFQFTQEILFDLYDLTTGQANHMMMMMMLILTKFIAVLAFIKSRFI